MAVSRPKTQSSVQRKNQRKSQQINKKKTRASFVYKRWTGAEEKIVIEMSQKYVNKQNVINWVEVAKHLDDRTPRQCMRFYDKLSKLGIVEKKKRNYNKRTPMHSDDPSQDTSLSERKTEHEYIDISEPYFTTQGSNSWITRMQFQNIFDLECILE